MCAPSNGAVDELTQRLALEGGGVWDNRGKAIAPRVVRVGKASEGAPDRVKAVSLDVMVEERWAYCGVARHSFGPAQQEKGKAE